MKFYIKEAKKVVRTEEPDKAGHMWVFKDGCLVRVDENGKELGRYLPKEFEVQV